MNLGKSFKNIRKEQKVLQKTLAKNLGVSVNGLSQIETNATFPRKETLIKISDSLKVSQDYLFLNSIEDKYVLPEDKIEFEVYFRKLKEILKRFNDKI